MRHGVYINHSKEDAQALLNRANEGVDYWSSRTVKRLLHDLVTLHDEVEHERSEKDNLRREKEWERN